MGMLAARSIIEGVRYNMEEVGNEKEYYEKGHFISINQDKVNN